MDRSLQLIFRFEGLGDAITVDEGVVEVDSGYLGDNRFMQPQHVSLKQAKIENKKGVVRGRHEGVNGPLKVYSI